MEGQPAIGRRYHTNWLVVASVATFWVVVLSIPMPLLMGGEVDLLSLAVIILFAPVFFLSMWPFTVLIDAMAPVKVFDTHLQSYMFHAQQTRIDWDRIKRLSTVDFGLGLKYLIIDDGGNALRRGWLPFFLKHPDRLYDDVVGLIGPEHLFARELRRLGFAGPAAP